MDSFLCTRVPEPVIPPPCCDASGFSEIILAPPCESAESLARFECSRAAERCFFAPLDGVFESGFDNEDATPGPMAGEEALVDRDDDEDDEDADDEDVGATPGVAELNASERDTGLEVLLAVAAAVGVVNLSPNAGVEDAEDDGSSEDEDEEVLSAGRRAGSGDGAGEPIPLPRGLTARELLETSIH